MVASAVVLPEPSEVAPPEPTLKRRQSSIESNTAKRPRISPEATQDSRSPPPVANGQERRRGNARGGGALEERKRGQRLFGAILGTLAQTSPSAGQRRRAEIEKKQQAKLRQKDDDDEDRKKQKKEELLAIRQREQKSWDEESMRIRHRNMLATARFLKTKAEPPLYYKPWDLRPEEEDTIQQQISDVENAIRREVADFEDRRRIESQKDTEEQIQAESRQSDPNKEPPDTGGKDGTSEQQDSPAVGKVEKATDNTNLQPSGEPHTIGNGVADTSDHVMADDHGGEELVEGQEDDVIY